LKVPAENTKPKRQPQTRTAAVLGIDDRAATMVAVLDCAGRVLRPRFNVYVEMD
jgi:hypothetical protein